MFELLVERRILVGHEVRRHHVSRAADARHGVERGHAHHRRAHRPVHDDARHHRLPGSPLHRGGGVNFDTKNAVFLFDSSAVQPGAAPIDTRIIGDKVYMPQPCAMVQRNLSGLQQASRRRCRRSRRPTRAGSSVICPPSRPRSRRSVPTLSTAHPLRTTARPSRRGRLADAPSTCGSTSSGARCASARDPDRFGAHARRRDQPACCPRTRVSRST